MRRALQKKVPDSFPSCRAVIAVRIITLLNPVQIEIQRNVIRAKLVDETGMSSAQIRDQLVEFGRVKAGINRAQSVSTGRFL